tara:strand:+ start:40768 stop:42468 length:1701 start_codon:yes stop_codon:yes gene_type:complete
MIEGLNPGIIVILGAFLIPLTSGFIRSLLTLALPVLALVQIYTLGLGSWGHYEFLGMAIEVTRIDPLARIFGTVFALAGLMGMVYALHVKDTVQQLTAMIYIGSAIGAVFAGDMITLFVFWELTAISSVFLIWASRTEASYKAGMRYLIIQVSSGVILLGGIILYYRETGNVEFGYIGLSSMAGALILIAFGIKSAFPFLHNWVQDAYPQATVTGTVILSAFTTKLAIYALARAFPGTEILIPIGLVMTIFPIIYIVLENDLRKVLAYSLNSQLGFMVIGVGVGTELALNGTAAHAFVHIMYKSLLFMCMGAVLYRTGTTRASELGGLFRSMPVTMIFCLIGALSIAGFPLTGGFVSKAMISSAAVEQGLFGLWLLLLFVRAGIMDHAGLKVPFFTFFAKDRGLRVKEAPLNMLIAMGFAAFFCIGLGVFPNLMFKMLPYEPVYNPYSFGHVMTAVQFLVFALAAFMLLLRYGLYPMERRSVILDFDWVYRVGLKRLALWLGRLIGAFWTWLLGIAQGIVSRVICAFTLTHGNGRIMARTTASSTAVTIIVAVLGGLVIFFYRFLQ